jgi:peptidyl-prolyl cis-trans isomerase B (cyclophilin B)
MNTFNDFYYLFSPTIADYERENPIFKEAVKIVIMPMISSLSLLNYVDMDSEGNVLGFGISLILLNVGMYFIAPGIVIYQIKKKF